jgi:hypothetical protein
LAHRFGGADIVKMSNECACICDGCYCYDLQDTFTIMSQLEVELQHTHLSQRKEQMKQC